jgi:hypothetical protein
LFAAFVPLLLFADWDACWRWEDLHYIGLWTPEGFTRNLVFDGFRALIPWLGLYTLGLAIGRRDDTQLARLAFSGAVLAVASAITSWIVVSALGADTDATAREEIVAVFGTGSMPPMPLFLATTVGTALVVIGASIHFPRIAPRPSAVLAATGRMAGTWVSHTHTAARGARHRRCSHDRTRRTGQPT